MYRHTEVLIIGGGVAGLSFAIEAASKAKVSLLTKLDLENTATSRAQGGISAVLGADDSFASHIEDTLVAGAGLCDREVVEFTIEHGPARIDALVEIGAKFNHVDPSDPGSPFDLGREGGHHKRRVVRAADMTGAEVQRVLSHTARAHPNIEILEQQIAVDIISSERLGLAGPNHAMGAYVLNRASGQVDTWIAPIVVLATGGAGKVYLYTSNPDGASGDGVAMGFRAGCAVANMEFFQFHPTCLFHPHAKSFLISEALRGEGGVLRLQNGTPFMDDQHPLKSLAPRDIVARAIDAELKRTGDECVSLDMTHRTREFLEGRFPGIDARCLELGIDMAQDPIPVVPAAHYLCGGLKVDLKGQTTVQGLLALGETACTGLHGANRLASNSLLEGLVFGHEAALHLKEFLEQATPHKEGEVPPWNPGRAVRPDEQVIISQNWDEIRRLMWNYVGIVRTSRRLERARRRLLVLREEIKEYYWDFEVTPGIVELRNIDTVAMLIVECASRRKESRGLHYTLDYEDNSATPGKDTIVERSNLLDSWQR